MGVLADYYRQVDILARMQLGQAGEYFWSRTRVDAPSAQAVVYLGCNVLRTIHLAEQLVALVQAIEGPSAEVITLGGPGHCCGSTTAVLSDDQAGAEKRGSRVVQTFRELSPRVLVMWCPVCDRRFTSYDTVDLANEPYETLHASEYLARNLARLPQMRTGKPRRIAVHEHIYDEATSRDAANVRLALSQLEGIEIVAGGEMDGFGYQCTAADEHPTPEFIASYDRSVHMTQDNGADTIASVYHGCHRVLARLSGRYTLDALNFLDPIAERAGLQVPDAYMSFIQINDEEAIWQRVAHRFPPHEEAEVREVIRAQLLSKADSPDAAASRN